MTDDGCPSEWGRSYTKSRSTVIPAPTFFLLPLGVGAPEVSPWLLGLNALATLFALTGRTSWLRRVALGFGIAGLIISLLPVSQLPATNQRAATDIVQALGDDYLAKIPKPVQAQMRSQPLVLADVFRGISTRQVRQTSGIAFAAPEGVPLKLDVYRPPQVGTYPAIVVLNGGAWQRGSPSENADFNRYMAAVDMWR